MRTFLHIRGRGRERVVLAIGVLSALLLASAALAPFSDPDLAGRAALSQLAGRVADGIVEEWSRIAKDPTRSCPPAGQMFKWGMDVPAPTVLQVRDILPDLDASASAFSTLLAEAERLEIRQHDARAALDIVLEALQKNLDAGQRAEARLRAIQLAVKVDDVNVVREQLEKTESELEGRAARKDTSYLLLSTLAASSKLDDASRKAACDKVLDPWSKGKIAIPEGLAMSEGPIQLDQAPTPWQMRVDPRYEALRQSLSAMCPDPDCTGAIAAEYELRKVRALMSAALMPLPPRPNDDAWQVIPLQGTAFGWHATAQGTEGCYFRVEDIGQALVTSARSHDLLPSGFRIDMTGNDESLGQVVRSRTELLGSEVGFTLRHSDPEAVVRSSGRRLWLLRGALFLLASFALGASFATARALRRERHLAEARSAFVANVSHELRTPLASILLMAENLETGRVTNEETSKRYHQSMRREANRLRRLVDDVLDFSRIERGKPIGVRLEDTALVPWAQDLRADAMAWAERCGAKLAIADGPLAESASIDGEALRRAIFNLLDNAVRHSGSVEIALSIQTEGAELVIAASDRGHGIPARSRSVIFEPFARLNGGQGGVPGTGLGLAIVREIAAAHGGSVSVRDQDDGSGAVFEIRIPLAAQASIDS